MLSDGFFHSPFEVGGEFIALSPDNHRESIVDARFFDASADLVFMSNTHNAFFAPDWSAPDGAPDDAYSSCADAASAKRADEQPPSSEMPPSTAVAGPSAGTNPSPKADAVAATSSHTNVSSSDIQTLIVGSGATLPAEGRQAEVSNITPLTNQLSFHVSSASADASSSPSNNAPHIQESVAAGPGHPVLINPSDHKFGLTSTEQCSFCGLSGIACTDSGDGFRCARPMACRNGHQVGREHVQPTNPEPFSMYSSHMSRITDYEAASHVPDCFDAFSTGSSTSHHTATSRPTTLYPPRAPLPYVFKQQKTLYPPNVMPMSGALGSQLRAPADAADHYIAYQPSAGCTAFFFDRRRPKLNLLPPSSVPSDTSFAVTKKLLSNKEQKLVTALDDVYIHSSVIYYVSDYNTIGLNWNVILYYYRLLSTSGRGLSSIRSRYHKYLKGLQSYSVRAHSLEYWCTLLRDAVGFLSVAPQQGKGGAGDKPVIDFYVALIFVKLRPDFAMDRLLQDFSFWYSCINCEQVA